MSGVPFAEQLWPSGTGPRRRYLALPSSRNTRLLIDASSTEATRRVVRAMRWSEHPLGRAQAAFADGASRLHLPTTSIRLAGGPDSLETFLSHALDRRALSFGWSFGPPRANRKPVGTMVDSTGEALGYAKVAVNDLTRRLMANEAETLNRLGTRLPGLVLPATLPVAEWRGLRVLVITPLTSLRHAEPLPDAAREAGEDGVAIALGRATARLGESGYWALAAKRARSAARPKSQWEAAIEDTLAVLHAYAATAPVTLGSWHGDWTRHNLALTDDGAGAWDWERFETGVPVGFDTLHFWLTERLILTSASGPAARELVAVAPQVLRRFVDRGEITRPRLIAVLYLLTIATRYMTDRQDLAGSLAAGFGDWLLGALPDLARALTTEESDA